MGRYMFCKLDDKNDILINLVPNKMKPDWSNKVLTELKLKKISKTPSLMIFSI